MAFLRIEPNSIVAPIHPKAKALQRPLPDDALELTFTGDKADNSLSA
ncbi:hypothetical protein [uncultured Ruegeria sp.]|nr:hypothetical protein [uncultured Ruegeria sp.]